MKPRSRSAGARKVGRRKSFAAKAPSTQAHSLDHLSTTELKQQRVCLSGGNHERSS
jgi:hypothetical protein